MAMRIIKVSKVEMKGIPCLYIKPASKDNKLPTVFLYHGWSSKKENYEFLGRILALHGFRVLIPDALNHGARGQLDYEDLKVMEKYFWQVSIHSVQEFDILLSEAQNKLGINPQRTAVMGHSMGGIVSGGIFVRKKNIQTLIVMNGACAWEDVEERVRTIRNVDRTLGIGPEKLREYDPYQSLDNFYPRPVLLQHGEDDQMVPIDSQIFFYNQLAPIYKAKPNDLRFTTIKNLNHHKTLAMLEEAIIWLDNVFLLSSEV